MNARSDKFSSELPVVRRFDSVADPENYRAIPSNWIPALSDVVGSTTAIAEGRYKAVNMAGASSICALVNICDDVLYAFGGDGAFAAMPGSCEGRARETLAKLRTWCLKDLGSNSGWRSFRFLRSALQVLMSWQASIKRAIASLTQCSAEELHLGGVTNEGGPLLVDAAAPGSVPDLTGLSCRWDPITPENGKIVSLLVYPINEENRDAFQALISEVVMLVGHEEREAHPIPEQGPAVSLTFKGVGYEGSAHPKKSFIRLRIAAQTVLAVLFDRLNLKIGSVCARQYRAEVARNSDFRKFDDGLKMTIDLTEPLIVELQKLLEAAAGSGVCRFGLQVQDAALMTCFASSLEARNHVHFIEGSGGGYAAVAIQAKARQAAASY